MKFKIAGFFALSVLAQSSMAAGLMGWNIGGDLDINSTTYKTATSSYGNTSVGASVNAGYTHKFSSPFTIGLSVSRDLNNSSVAWTSTDSLSITKHTAYSIEPGYMLGSGALLYAKLSYNQGTLKGNGFFSYLSGSSVNGWGKGLGIKVPVTASLYAVVEVNLNEYNNVISPNTGNRLNYKTTQGAAGVSYFF